ncbi:DUF2993 domain-containing protein [Streptomyces sp. NPDC088785]|uniref:LmeA family phospholipid-binding protein n=1 Tax=Streptomyces sp. NPDC088785 TaxID=3365897 RepID=UPI0038007ADE
MRALRILLILVVILGGLFVIADRVAVHIAEGEAADRIRESEGLASTPSVSIGGFPFLTQVADGTLDDVEVGIDDYEAKNADGSIRIADMDAHMHGVKFAGDYSSATAASATGTATVSYAELRKAVRRAGPARVGPGISAQIDGLAYAGDHKIRLTIAFQTPLGTLRPTVTSAVGVTDGKLTARADSLPKVGSFDLGESTLRGVTDFRQAIDNLPAGIELDKVEAGEDGVEISVTGSDLRLVG